MSYQLPHIYVQHYDILSVRHSDIWWTGVPMKAAAVAEKLIVNGLIL